MGSHAGEHRELSAECCVPSLVISRSGFLAPETLLLPLQPSSLFSALHTVISDSCGSIMNLWALLLAVAFGMVLVIAAPAMDRPGKQRDYARLSHPENINTVYAKATVENAIPLNSYTGWR